MRGLVLLAAAGLGLAALALAKRAGFSAEKNAHTIVQPDESAWHLDAEPALGLIVFHRFDRTPRTH